MYFLIIPSNVYLNDKITSEAKICYGLILSLSNTLGYSYATNDFMADHLGISIRTVQRYIKELEAAKLIRLEYIANKRRLIYPIIGPSDIEKGLRSQNKPILTVLTHLRQWTCANMRLLRS